MKTRIKSKKSGRCNILTVCAVAILLLVGICGLWTQKKTEELCAGAEELLESTVQSAGTGDFLSAEISANSLREFWSSQRTFLGLFYEHEAANLIEEGIARLCVYVGEESFVSVKAEAESIKSQLKVLSAYDSVSAVNIV